MSRCDCGHKLFTVIAQLVGTERIAIDARGITYIQKLIVHGAIPSTTGLLSTEYFSGTGTGVHPKRVVCMKCQAAWIGSPRVQFTTCRGFGWCGK